jgi:pilus assembly protein CpaC
MLRRKLSRVALVVFGCWASLALAQESELSLGVGISKTLKIAGVRTVSIANPRVADVKVVHGQILVNGLSVGKTSLIVWKRNGQRVSYLVVVRKDDIVQTLHEIQQLLAEVEGVTIRQVGDRILLEGRVYTSADADRVEQVGKLYPDQVKSFVVFDLR